MNFQGSYTVRLYDAIQRNLLNPKSAYAYDSITRKNFFLDDACDHSIITAQNRYIDRQTTQTLTLNDALKHGLIKLGDYLRQTASGNCTLTSETQSMSVRSIKDPSTNEYLAPTEAIKRKILDPYKGLFIHPHTDERLPISDAINKGFVIVEILTDLNHNETLVERDTNLISTNLIRETKSYHLISMCFIRKNHAPFLGCSTRNNETQIRCASTVHSCQELRLFGIHVASDLIFFNQL